MKYEPGMRHKHHYTDNILTLSDTIPSRHSLIEVAAGISNSTEAVILLGEGVAGSPPRMAGTTEIPFSEMSRLHSVYTARLNGCVVRTETYWNCWLRDAMLSQGRSLVLLYGRDGRDTGCDALAHEDDHNLVSHAGNDGDHSGVLLGYMHVRRKPSADLLSVTEWVWNGAEADTFDVFISALSSVVTALAQDEGVLTKVTWPAQILTARDGATGALPSLQEAIDKGLISSAMQKEGFMYRAQPVRHKATASWDLLTGLHGLPTEFSSEDCVERSTSSDPHLSRHVFWGADGF